MRVRSPIITHLFSSLFLFSLSSSLMSCNSDTITSLCRFLSLLLRLSPPPTCATSSSTNLLSLLWIPGRETQKPESDVFFRYLASERTLSPSLSAPSRPISKGTPCLHAWVRSRVGSTRSTVVCHDSSDHGIQPLSLEKLFVLVCYDRGFTVLRSLAVYPAMINLIRF